MQPNVLTLSFTSAAEGNPTVIHNFEKRILGPYECEFREESTVLAPELAKHRLRIKAKEPIPSSSSFGTLRHWSTYTRELLCSSPDGVNRLRPLVIKAEASTPPGIINSVEREDAIAEFRAWVMTDEFVDAVFKAST